MFHQPIGQLCPTQRIPRHFSMHFPHQRLEPLFAAFSAQLTHADLGCRWLRRHVCNLGAAQHFSHGRLPRAQEGKRVQLLADSKWCSSAFYGPLVDWGCMGPAQRLVKVTSDDALRYLRAQQQRNPPCSSPPHTHTTLIAAGTRFSGRKGPGPHFLWSAFVSLSVPDHY